MADEDSGARLRRWTRTEYDRLIAHGVLGEDERIELLDGVLVVREPQAARHSAALVALEQTLIATFGPGFHVRPQLPLALDDASEPEPDAVVVRGAPWDYARAHPTTPLLLVEIAETSLAIDRDYKGSLYARSGIADYWILNLVDSVLEVYRDPAPAASAPFGWEYCNRERLARQASISPLAASSAVIAVASLLPPT